ncbi:hypothetical protein LguiA_029200 [Lonicera macranthoides]
MEDEEQVQVEPSSPCLSPLQLNHCIEELLHFTLSSSIDETLGVDLDIYEGVPSYPLYKRLASALCQSISSGSICRTFNNMTLIHEDDSLKQKEEEWDELILNKGSELVNILKTVDFDLHVQEPFFSQLKDGLKTIEGRCAVGDYNRIGSGALILFNKCLVLQVEDVHCYASFSEMLEAESLTKVLPGVETIEEGYNEILPSLTVIRLSSIGREEDNGVQVYRKFYSEEKEMLNGVVAICVTKLASQLYLSLATILSGLSYDGIQRLLGLAHTVGTISEALPPPRSTLLSSFLEMYCHIFLFLDRVFSLSWLEVKGSKLTDGARALAKHLNRSSDGYWGTFCGSDSNKNMLAVDVIRRLIDHCCWLNMHIVPPHGVVFEIRVYDGYGARWSQDGTKTRERESSGNHFCCQLIYQSLYFMLRVSEASRVKNSEHVIIAIVFNILSLHGVLGCV